MKAIFWRLIVFSLFLSIMACSPKATSELTSLYIINFDGGEPVLLLSDPDNRFWGPSWSPDGSRIVFSVFRENKGELYLANSDGSGMVQLTHNGRSNYLP